ncbi:hypothetical protein F4604DRAFT_1940323 [Suillus subluteus]|nr:hypothetical protein F4604DRAFT_1940323 [Suillus subluteus]
MTVNIPLELVMKVLTLATHRREEAASWICLSKRTYILFERLLYNKVVLKDEDHAFRFLECYRLRQTHIDPPPSTTSMFLGDDITYTTLVEILSLCKDITNLSIASVDDDFIRDLTNLHHVLEPLPLTVLCLNIKLSLTHRSMVMANTFATLTHLEIDDKDMLRLVDMNAFPKLTHLALWFVSYNPGVDVPGVVKRLLQHATLQVLVFRVNGHSECARFLESHGIVDRRIIIGPSRKFVWDDFGHGDMLLWKLADDRANMLAPNHKKHRCFSNSTFENRFRDYKGLPRVPERDVDRGFRKCLGPVDSEERTEVDSNDEDIEEDSLDEVEEDSPNEDKDEQSCPGAYLTLLALLCTIHKTPLMDVFATRRKYWRKAWDDLQIARQEDRHSCGVLAINALAHFIQPTKFPLLTSSDTDIASLHYGNAIIEHHITSSQSPSLPPTSTSITPLSFTTPSSSLPASTSVLPTVPHKSSVSTPSHSNRNITQVAPIFKLKQRNMLDDDSDTSESQFSGRLLDIKPKKRKNANGETVGRPRTNVLGKVTRQCHKLGQPKKQRYRCLGENCRTSLAAPANRKRLLKHAASCHRLPITLRREVTELLARESLGAQVEKLEAARGESLQNIGWQFVDASNRYLRVCRVSTPKESAARQSHESTGSYRSVGTDEQEENLEDEEETWLDETLAAKPAEDEAFDIEVDANLHAPIVTKALSDKCEESPINSLGSTRGDDIKDDADL